MYIEIIHDAQGNIVGCWCADTLPEGGTDQPLVTFENGLPPGHEQVRINIDTLTAMEIEEACKQKAVVDPVTGEPKIQKLDRAQYIMANYRVDMTQNIPVPAAVKMPAGMQVRILTRKT